MGRRGDRAVICGHPWKRAPRPPCRALLAPHPQTAVWFWRKQEGLPSASLPGPPRLSLCRARQLSVSSRAAARVPAARCMGQSLTPRTTPLLDHLAPHRSTTQGLLFRRLPLRSETPFSPAVPALRCPDLQTRASPGMVLGGAGQGAPQCSPLLAPHLVAHIVTTVAGAAPLTTVTPRARALLPRSCPSPAGG